MENKNETSLLYKIKSMTYADLDRFASEIRSEILKDVSLNGGHLASNLGVVELTLALHKVFDSPKDKIIWDVGHQSYVHKLLTGRWKEMETLRRHGGISGFPKRSESPHDAYDSGHSGSSISAAFGYAKARDLKGESYSCVAVIGDGSFTGGMPYEALNCAGSDGTPLIVILNDNEMSISENSSSLSRYLERLRTSDAYQSLKTNIKNATRNMPNVNKSLGSIKKNIRSAIGENGELFESLGFKYYGPYDGHDIAGMCKAFRFARNARRPVVVHVITKKGKGFVPAELNPEKYHGIGPFDISKADARPNPFGGTYSEYFGEILLKLAERDHSVCAVTAAMLDATGLKTLKRVHPERVFDEGIAEQHAVSFAAGLALNGMKPVVAIYSTFLQRAYDQILTEVCLQDLPVVFAVDRAGVTGNDGETHQGCFDISYLYSMPNMTILSPSNTGELEDCFEYALRLGHPCAIRYPRGKAYEGDVTRPDITEPVLLRRGRDVLFVTSGSMVATALQASEELENHDIDAAVLELVKLKPLNESRLRSFLEEYPRVITLEDGIASGGFGIRVAAGAARIDGSKVLNLGWPDKFIEHGSIAELREAYGLDPVSVAQKAVDLLEEKA